MKNGYYISAYCCIDEIGCILNAQIRHDQSIALWKKEDNKIVLVKYWELERVTRKKQHMQPFLNIEHFEYVLQNLLRQVGLDLDDIVKIFGIPEYKNNKTFIKISNKYDIPLHSLGHIFSAIIDTKKQFTDDNLILAMDGGPDNLLDNGFDKRFHYAAIYLKNGEFVDVDKIESPAYLWTEASDKFLLREGTLMALAEACTCSYDGDLGFKYFPFYSMRDIPQMRKEFERIWSIIESAKLKFDDRFTEKENRISCFMKIIQKASQEIVERNLEYLIKKYSVIPNKTILSFVGGFALNCPTNTYIMKKYAFKDFISPPCVNDSGMALGIGLMAFYFELGNKMEFDLNNAYYGFAEKGTSFISRFSKFIKSSNDFNIEQFIQDIENMPVCWFDSEAEIGPRALGHRSILSSARTIEMKDILNNIKQREWWRPVAPIILEESLNDWCEMQIPSPYMLHAIDIKEEKRKFVPAILHLNNSARLQTIDKSNSFYYILKQYLKKTGVPIICNTSLNDKGEPIINNYDELFNFALRKKFKVIYVANKRIELCNYDNYLMNEPFIGINAFSEYLKNYENEFNKKFKNVTICEEDLDFYVNHKCYFNKNDIFNQDLKAKIEEVKKRIDENLSS